MTANPLNSETPVVRRPDKKRPDGSGRTGKRSFDIDDELWFAAVGAAHRQGVTLASVLRSACRDLVDSTSPDP